MWQTGVETSSMNNPLEQIKASMFEGKLTVEINGNKQ